MRCVVVQSHHRFGRLPFTASLALLRERIDVIHVQQASPLLFGAPIVLTLHDIAYERYPQWFPPEVISKMRWAIPLTVRRAAAVLTDSEFSKRDVVRRYCVPPDKVVVAPLAADPMFRPLHDPAHVAAVRERYGTGERFILCVGNLEPHKNLATLIEAYVRLRRADATRHRLVLVGRPQRENNAVFATARASGYQEALIFTGYVPAEDLVALFNAAHLFVFPSIFEGFGAPPLEAMACGTPVITSNAASLPEVVGDAAPMVDPLDVEGLASAIATVLADADLRARLAAQGLQRAAAFSWEATARIVLDTYRNAVQSSRRLW
jgi:glycosyltransferase involved in cell wall biosynthesis